MPVAMYQAPVQEDFEFRVDDQDWTAVKLLTDELEEELVERRGRLVMRMATWLIAVRVFKKTETRRMVLKQPSARDQMYHRALLGLMRGLGEALFLEVARQGELDAKALPIDPADFEAAVVELRYSEREWYGDMKQERREEILGDVFGTQPQ